MEDITLKKLLMAGLGSMAYTYEKGAEIVEELIKKGELTISQGKELNQELKRKSSEEKTEPSAKANQSLEHEGAVWEMLRDVLSGMDIATKEDIKKLEERLSRLEGK
jgi:polyhydroxyalkanoate synthesis regulator phasin